MEHNVTEHIQGFPGLLRLLLNWWHSRCWTIKLCIHFCGSL